ncbi:MAG TPA: hypothetical protein VGW75_15690 [Solirubrobacteraceae bacterium]|nr:hypothetical protein [Solirubrobacteraceae bacterium]
MLLTLRVFLYHGWRTLRRETMADAGSASQAAAGALFFLSLAPDDRAACGCHSTDWRVIADASVELLDRLPAGADGDTVRALTDGVLDDQVSTRWLASLFVDPIVFAPSSPSVTDGQHRACDLRCSGARWVVAEVSDREPVRGQPTGVAPDPARRACAVLAQF